MTRMRARARTRTHRGDHGHDDAARGVDDPVRVGDAGGSGEGGQEAEHTIQRHSEEVQHECQGAGRETATRKTHIQH